MFVVILTYTADLAQIDAALADHAQWLAEQYHDGVFLLSGPRVPRTGGVILAVNTSRADLDRRLAGDPFRVRGLAEQTIIECVPTRVAEGLSALDG